MANSIKITGNGSSISLGEKSVARVLFDSDTPHDSNARATDYVLGMKVWGKILFDIPVSDDPTLELAKWSQVPYSKADCYRRVDTEVIHAGQTVREYTLTDAFVVEYSEEMNVEMGADTFYLYVRQKKDENERVTINGRSGIE